MAKASCIMCDLVHERIEVTKIYEDDLVSAVMDIRPVNPGHVLVVSHTCVPLIVDLDDATIQRMFFVAKRINAAIRASGLECEGVNYLLSDGEAAMQEIPHVHLHIFPRYVGDGFGLRFPPGYWDPKSRDVLEQAANLIRAKM